MRLVRYLFTAVLALSFVSCNKGRSSDKPQLYNPFNGKDIVWDKISYGDYELSSDGLTLIKWENTNTTNLDMNRDPRLTKVKIIGTMTWGDCYSLANINISSSVTSIGEEAFRGCRGLTRVVFKGNNPPKIAYKVFEDTPSSFKLIVPKGAKSAYIKAGYPEDKLIEE